MLLLCVLRASAQELEPRAYSPAPVGTNFIGLTYSRLSGQVLTDPSLPVSNIHADINAVSLGYVRVFDLAGYTAQLGVLAPFVSGNVSGDVLDSPTQVHRAGLGDVRFRLAVDLLGGRALTPEEFARRVPGTIVGVSLTVVAPTGQYEPAHLVNVGTNRWAFKPEFGISQPLGNWFLEATAGVWLFTDNDSFLGNKRRSQAPLATLQLHAGYTFRPGLWLAFDAGFYAGGKSTVNGVGNDDRQNNSRYGITLAIPVTRGWSAKLAVSNGLLVRAGGNYKAISLALQYRWFN
ncbi:transporter [Paraburkholderia sp. EG304]|uniref:transporter n=1 Tax=Paraburkholderia sp. EG304 TaxID=3237015 RepID=UPI00397E6647